jgi:hypothetical protein
MHVLILQNAVFLCVTSFLYLNIAMLFNNIRIPYEDKAYPRSNMTGTTSGAGTANPSGAPQFNPVFKWGSYLLDV